jgi:hypothetical protein
MGKAKRILLDSNVWRMVADHRASELLGQQASQQGVEILVAPSVAFEALRTSDENLRRKLASTIASARWRKLMPEAYEEAEEFIDEVRRLRPEWIVHDPTLSYRDALIRDWRDRKQSFWSRVRLNPSVVREHIRQAEGEGLDALRVTAASQRRQFQEVGLTFDHIDRAAFSAVPVGPLPGWNGDLVETWRVSALYYATSAFKMPPMSEWIMPLVAVPAFGLRSESWNRFWLYDCDASNMVRWWIRDAFQMAAFTRKISSGTVCDIQLATYLSEADVFVSADKVMIAVAEKVRGFAPAPLALSVLIPGTCAGPEDLVASIINAVPNA